MDENMIIEEFLNHFYTIPQLADYLRIDEERINNVISSKLKVDDKISKSIKKHISNIELYNNEKTAINICDGNDKSAIKIGLYIYFTNSSIRKTSQHFKLSKTTIGKYIDSILPETSIYLYKKVFDVMQNHKSLSIQYKEKQDILYQEIKLLEQGCTIEEIGTELSLSRNRVQRDLANRSKLISERVNNNAKKRLEENRMRNMGSR